jgi:hypothetical protein
MSPDSGSSSELGLEVELEVAVAFLFDGGGKRRDEGGAGTTFSETLGGSAVASSSVRVLPRDST